VMTNDEINNDTTISKIKNLFININPFSYIMLTL